MADYNLGTARGKIEVGYDGKGVQTAARDLKNFSTRANDLKGSFTKVASVTAAGAGIIATGIGLAVKAAIDFEKQISAIGAVSGATGKELEKVRAKALQLGADTAFSASEAANAMEELVKAGISVDDVLNGAADATVALAAAGGIALPEAATIASNAMNQFGLSAKQMPHIADLIAGAANSSAIDVKDFGFSLQQAGAVANLAGLTFDDLSTAIALMGNAGIKGSDAGTSLKTMLLNLQPSTKKQTELFEKLGIITEDGANRFFDSTGKLKSFGEVAGVLQGALKGMTKAQQAATLETLFGSDAIRAAAVVAKAGSKGFDEMATSIGKISAADVAKKRLDNVAGAIEQLKGSIETAAIAFGTAFLPVIKTVAQFIATLANKFSSLDPRWQKLIAFGLAAVGALLAVVSALAALGAIIAGVAASLVAVKIAAIIAAIVVAVGLLIAGFKALMERSAAFRSAVATAFNAVKGIVSGAIGIFKDFVSFIATTVIPIIRDGIKKAIDNLAPAFNAIKGFITGTIVPGFQKLFAAVKTAMPALKQVAVVVGTVLATAFKVVGKVLGTVIPIILKIAGPVFKLLFAGISFLISGIPTLINIIKFLINVFKVIGQVILAIVVGPFVLLWKAAVFAFDLIKAGLAVLLQVWNAIWAVLGPPVVAVFNLIKAIIQTVFTIITTIISVAWAVIKGIFQVALAVILAIVTPVFNAIKAVITSVMNFLMPFISAAWNTIKAVITTVVNIVKSIITTAWNAIKSVITTVFNVIKGVVQTVWDAIKSIIQSAVARVIAIINGIKAIVDKVKEFFGKMKDAATGGVDKLVSFVKGIPGKVLSAIGNLGSLLFNAGKNIIQGLIDGVKNMFGALKDAFSFITDLIPDWKGPMERDKKLLTPSGRAIMQGLVNGVKETMPLLQSQLSKVTNSISDPIQVQAALVAQTTMPPRSVSASANSGFTGAGGARTFTVGNVTISGVWDFTDPLAARKIVAKLHEELDKFEKEHR